MSNQNLSQSGMAGITNIPVQRHRKISRLGTNFTLMVVGETGSGKTTFINTLFATALLGHKKHEENKAFDRTVRIEVVRVDVEERGFPLRLTLIDTPGFGDYVNNQNCWGPIVEFIDSRHDDFLKNETSPRTKAKEDLRVHVCLYFIQPTGKTLRSIDLRMLKELCTRVNLIPVISKADTMTQSEINAFKERVKHCMQYHRINTYIPSPLNDDNESIVEAQKLANAMPFSIISSEELHEVGDRKRVCGRRYQWGLAEVENEAHCDFKKLKTMIMKSHMHDLIDQTVTIHYENYRSRTLEGYGRNDDETEEVATKNLDMVIKEEMEIKERFKERVKLEESRFIGWEEKLCAKREELNKDLEQRHRRVKALEEENSRLLLGKRP